MQLKWHYKASYLLEDNCMLAVSMTFRSAAFYFILQKMTVESLSLFQDQTWRRLPDHLDQTDTKDNFKKTADNSLLGGFHHRFLVVVQSLIRQEN